MFVFWQALLLADGVRCAICTFIITYDIDCKPAKIEINQATSATGGCAMIEATEVSLGAIGNWRVMLKDLGVSVN